MKKRWSKKPNAPVNEKPMSVADKLRSYGHNYIWPCTPAQRRRLRKTARAAYGRAVGLRGAAKGSAMRKLATLPLDGILSDEQLAVIRDPKWAIKKLGVPRTVKER